MELPKEKISNRSFLFWLAVFLGASPATKDYWRKKTSGVKKKGCGDLREISPL